jgi:hypothetical protein
MTSPRIDNYQIYWQDVVAPDYQDFLRRDDDLRSAFHCAISLFHMHDWLYRANPAQINQTFTYRDRNGNSQLVHDPRTFANAVADLCADFELIRGIANSVKHLELTPRPNAPAPRNPATPTHAANTYFSIASVHRFLGFTLRTAGQVMLQGPGGQDRPVTDVARTVYQFWPGLCQANGWALVA